MKFKVDWVKLKKFFFWLIGWMGWSETLSPPIKCRIIKNNEKSLLGKSYYFCNPKSWKVKSPLEGTISKIYPNHMIHITNKRGLQILVDIQTDKKTPMPLDKILQCEVKKGQKVSRKTTLFIIYLEEQVISVSVYIPWQPELLRSISSLEKNNENCFVKIYYRNPYDKLRFKNHGKY